MSLYSGCHINVIYVFVVCFLLHCLFISENEVHADSTPSNVKPIDKTTKSVSTTKLPPNHSEIIHVTEISKTKAESITNGVNATQNSETVTPGNSSTIRKRDPPKNISAGAVVRGFYVFVGLGAIVVMYIVVRTVRLRRKKTTVRKYGILASREDVEMTPLGADDDEEDMTLFDMSSHKSRP